MYKILEKDSNSLLGTISEEHFQFLRDSFEEESDSDTDYYIDAATIEMLEENGCDALLIAQLRNWLGARDGLELRWEKA